ncbi:Hypothetical predicted protein [Paramuricea clavata]|uniref:Uncharacterized protein n=1 Tax=Paramuricea clavata TaxID=317549 RepID=A0A6S7GNS1_PARCT|nr:Hypothetical predicted protein [Paramuricea clavata]
MANELYLNLKTNGERFYWASTWCELKKIVLDDLKLTGRWTSPGGEVKLFTSDNLSTKWHGKSTKWITVIGGLSDTLDLTNLLTSISGKAADCQDEIPKNCELIDADEGKHNGCSNLGEQANVVKDIHMGCTSLGEQVAGMSEAIDQTAPLPTNTTNRID